MSNRLDEMYTDDIENILPCSEEEIERLVKQLPDKAAADRLIEGSLDYVLKMAQERKTDSAELSDLIQEGNIAMMLLVNNYSTGDFLRMREIAVTTAMEQFLDEQKTNEELGDKLASSINVLNVVVTRLAEELDRQPSLAEIAAKMQMSEDEISTLMKQAIAAVSNDRENAAEKESGSEEC